MKLIRPTKKYESEWRKAVEEFRNDPKSIKVWESLGDPDDLDACIRNAKLHSKGKNLPNGWVSYHLYWLIDNDEIVGIASVRHRLNALLRGRGGHIGAEIRPSKRNMGYGGKILELSLIKLKRAGLRKVLVTSFDSNTASYKIIEKHGGKLKNKILAPGESEITRRYRINI